MIFNPDDWLEIGKIVAPQGLRGEIRIYPSTDFPERFLTPGERWLLKPGSPNIEAVQLTKGRLLEGKGVYVITLKGITTREQAEQLRNSRLWVPEGDRPPLEEGEFHVADLIGLSVYHQTTGDYIGEVIDVLSAGNDILEVRQPTDSSESTSTDKQPKPQSTTPDPTKPTQKSPKKSKSILIPFVYDIAPVVDLHRQRIEVLPPKGLIDL
ncbi:MAG: ribosome maturation factor RimM [Leptolyngbyaceae bacterium]|nr:ribosome maturation factor RimM [Leptolyngbyaceae bacterium]